MGGRFYTRLIAGLFLSGAAVAGSGGHAAPSVSQNAAAVPDIWAAPAPTSYRNDKVTVIRAGRLFDARAGIVRTNQMIVIRGDRIVSVGADGPIPDHATVVDLSGYTVLPGLIDAHLHVMAGSPLTAPGGHGVGPYGTTGVDGGKYAGASAIHRQAFDGFFGLANAQLDLKAGFTTIVDLLSMGTGYGTVELRDAINVGLVQGPRMQVAGPGLVMTARWLRIGATENMGAMMADGPDELRKAVRTQVGEGVDWIKIFSDLFGEHDLTAEGFSPPQRPSFTLEETKAIVDEAHHLGVKVACHAYGGQGLRNCVDAGADAPQHAVQLDDQTLKKMVAQHQPLTVTFFDHAITAEKEMAHNNGRSKWAMQRASFQKALAAGLPLVFGSGAGPFPHGTQIEQLVYMVKWGMTPVQALQSATTVAAKHIGWEADVGAVEPGKYADLIALPGDPAANISDIMHIGFVMKGGEIIRDDLHK